MIFEPPRINLDEDLDFLLAALLRARGYDVVHTVDEAPDCGVADPEPLVREHARWALESIQHRKPG